MKIYDHFTGPPVSPTQPATTTASKLKWLCISSDVPATWLLAMDNAYSIHKKSFSHSILLCVDTLWKVVSLANCYVIVTSLLFAQWFDLFTHTPVIQNPLTLLSLMSEQMFRPIYSWIDGRECFWCVCFFMNFANSCDVSLNWDPLSKWTCSGCP